MSRPADLLLRLGDTTPAWPTAGQISLYAKTDGEFYKLDSNGVETPLSVGGTGGSGTVTSVQASGNSGIVVSGGPITTSGVFSFSLGNITPDSVNSTGTIIGSNLSGINTGDETAASIRTKLGITTLSGTNTGDQTITLTGDATGSGTGTFPVTLATVNADVGTFGSSTQIPIFTVDAKGRVVSVSSEPVAISSTNVISALGYTPYDSSNPAGYTSNLGTVTSINGTGSDGVVVGGFPITTSGTITIGLGDITPTSVTAVGAVTGGNLSGINTGDETAASIRTKLGITTLSGSNTGDQTITLTGDVTGSGTGTFPATLATVNADVGTFGSSTQIPVLSVDAKGRVTGITTVSVGGAAYGVSSFNTRTGDIQLTGNDVTAALGYTPYNSSNPAGYTSNTGTVTQVALAGEDGIIVDGSPITTTGTLTLTLGNITPASVAASGTITGSNLSGTNTGDQTITLTGDVTGSGTGSFAATLSDTGVVPGTYGSISTVPQIVIDSKGRITSAVNVGIAEAGLGTVSSVDISGGTTGLIATGGPITTTGTITLGGVLSIAAGGTGATDPEAALNNILPPQSGAAGHYLTTDGINAFWNEVSSMGTVTSVTGTTLDGVTVSVSNPTTTPTLSVSLGAITPTSVAATGTVTGSNLSGTNTGDETADTIRTKLGITTLSGSNTGDETAATIRTKLGITTLSGSNTGDQTITLTGDVTGSGTGTFPATLATVNSAPQTDAFRRITVNGKGLVTATSAVVASDITTALGYTPYNSSNPAGYTSNAGTVTSVSATGSNGITVSGSPITASGTLAFGLGAITPTSVAATGTVTGSNLSGTNTGDETAATIRTKLGITTLSGSNTGDQTITLTGDVTGSGTGSFAATLSDTGVVAGTYSVATLTVDSKGRVTAISSGSASGTGTVTSVALSSTNNTLQISGSPITSNGTIDVDLANSGVTAGTYSNADITVDSYGRVTNATSGYRTTEIVVLRYSPGGSGTLNVADAIYSQTPGVTATVTDGPNSIVKFAFTGKTHPPKSITFYGQVVSTNNFVIKTPVGLTTTVIAGGGTSAVPDLANGIFSSDNVVTVTCTAANTGSVGAVGVRSFALVEFGF